LAIIDAIRRKLEQPISADSSETVLNSFLLPQESAEGCNDGNGKRRADHKLTMLLNETRDVLESLEFNQILSRCLNLSFYAMAHQLHSCFSQTQQQQQQQVAYGDATKDLTTPTLSGLSPEPAMPMAKLMPLVNKQVSQLLASDPNPFLDTVLHDDQLRQYAFDLFTAFGADE
jgi:hypothetical protein